MADAKKNPPKNHDLPKKPDPYVETTLCFVQDINDADTIIFCPLRWTSVKIGTIQRRLAWPLVRN